VRIEIQILETGHRLKEAREYFALMLKEKTGIGKWVEKDYKRNRDIFECGEYDKEFPYFDGEFYKIESRTIRDRNPAGIVGSSGLASREKVYIDGRREVLPNVKF